MMKQTLRSLSGPASPVLPWAVAGAIAAALVGGTSSIRPGVAAALAIAVAAAVACFHRASALLIVLIASVFLEIVSFGGITITRLVAPIALLFVLAAASRGAARLRYGPPLGWAAGYVLWALASALWTVDSGGTTFLLGSLGIALVYTVAFGALVASEGDLQRVLYVFTAASFAVGLFAIASFAGIVGAGTLQQGRASGAAGDANFFAAYQLVAFPLALVLAANTSRRAARLALTVVVLVIVGSVLTTISRGGLVALAAVTLIALVLPSRSVFRSRGQKAAMLVIILVGAGVVLKGLSGDFAPRINAIFTGKDAGGSGREVLWGAAWQSAKGRPLLGLGYGAFKTQSNSLVLETPNLSLVNYDLRPGGEETHSAYLGTLTELGIPGLALFLGLLVSTARALQTTAAKARAVGSDFVARAATALLISLAGWSVASLFLSSETSRPLWIIVGLALALPKLVAEHEDHLPESDAADGSDA